MGEEMSVIIEGTLALAQRNVAMIKRSRLKRDNRKYVWL